MEFHISRAIREKLAIDGLLFSYTGNVIFANVRGGAVVSENFEIQIICTIEYSHNT